MYARGFVGDARVQVLFGWVQRRSSTPKSHPNTVQEIWVEWTCSDGLLWPRDSRPASQCVAVRVGGPRHVPQVPKVPDHDRNANTLSQYTYDRRSPRTHDFTEPTHIYDNSFNNIAVKVFVCIIYTVSHQRTSRIVDKKINTRDFFW